jgi:hypothetical protein
LFVGARGGQFFDRIHAESVFQRTGKKARDSKSFGDASVELNILAESCVTASRQGTARTARDWHKLFQSAEHHTGKLLRCFGLTGSFDRLVSNDLVNALILRVPPDDAGYRVLHMHVAREVGAPGKPLGERQALHVGLWCLQLMKHCLGLLAGAPRPAADVTREAPREELILVMGLHELYEDLTGDSRWQTTPIDGPPVPGGPFVRLVMAVAGHIHDHLHLVKPPPPPSLARNLELLSKSPRRIGLRITAVRQLG